MKGPRIVKKKSIDTAKDPYLNKSAPNGTAYCRKCGAAYKDKRWSFGVKAREEAEAAGAAVLCPACQKIKDGYAEGFVTLQGEFLKEHEEEILNLVRNKEERAMYTNPLNRIIKISRKKGTIEISTTTDKLAQRIGQMLKKAFCGEVEYKWSSDVKIARVVWSR